jgi:hypothetical protein
MQFQGQIKKMLPSRQGVSQRTGNKWKSQPFIFEYFENPSDRYSDTVLLETFDESIMSQLKEGLKVTIGFGHRVREYTPTTGDRAGQTQYMNECRIYHFEVAKGQNHATPSSESVATSTHTSPQGQDQKQDDKDDLPF